MNEQNRYRVGFGVKRWMCLKPTGILLWLGYDPFPPLECNISRWPLVMSDSLIMFVDIVVTRHMSQTKAKFPI